MKIYFKNPITLILYQVINLNNTDQKLEAVYVDPDISKSDYDAYWHTKESDSNYRISEYICKYFGISLSRISWKEFLSVQKCFTECLIAIKISGKANSIIFYAADYYCFFGFKTYIKFFRVKIKLVRHFRKHLIVKKDTKLFILNPNNLPINNLNIRTIDTAQSYKYLEIISKSILPSLIKNEDLKLNVDCVLVLPYPNFNDQKYNYQFRSRVLEVAHSENLKVLVKPHRKDKTDYSTVFGDYYIKPINDEFLRLIPVEFFLTLHNVKKIISAPSTSLVFAENSKLEVLAPKNSISYKKFFLDCEPYLKFIGKSYRRV